MTDTTRVCRKCLVYDEADKAAKDIDKYLDRLRPEDLVSDKIFEDRIAVCKACDRLFAATCRACGCYVEFRANVKQGRCPKNKWKI